MCKHTECLLREECDIVLLMAGSRMTCRVAEEEMKEVKTQ